jgi:hypothetical protein
MASDHLSTQCDQLHRLSINPLFITLALFVLIAVFQKSQLSTILPLSVDAPKNVFSSARAFNMLELLTKEQVPHPVDSQANRVIEKRIVRLLRDMGYQEDIQQTQICHDTQRGSARCTQVRNIIVEIPGTSADKGILLAAHYDSVPAGPGGSDAGAAVGTLLETARLLKLEKQPRNTIVLLFNEGEEFGLFGAKAFMEQHPLGKQLKLAINVEARGSTGKSVMFETGENSGWLVKHYADTTPAPMSSSLFYEVYKALPNDTDLTVFKEHGLQGLNFAHAQRLAHYHTPLDNIANLDKGSLQHHGDNVWGVLKIIKDQNLNNVAIGNLVYSDIMGLFVIKWTEPTSLILSLLCLVIFICMRIYSNKTSLYKSIITPAKLLFYSALVLITTSLSAYCILFLVTFISGYYAPWHANQLPMQLAVWLSVAVSGLIVGKYLVKKLQVADIYHGVVLFWIILSITTSIWLTGISFLFIIPAISGVISQIFLLKRTRQNDALYSLILIFNAAISAIMFIPIAYIVAIMIGYELSVAIGLVLGLIIIATLPLMAIQNNHAPLFHKLAFTAAGLMVITGGWTSFQAPHSAWLPQRLNLQYVQNDQNEAFITYGYEQHLIPDKLTASFEQKPQLKTFLPWSNWPTYVAKVTYQPSDLTNHNVPTFEILTKGAGEGAGKGKYSITAQISTASNNLSDVKLYIPVTSGLTRIDASNHSINYQDEQNISNGFYVYHCRGISCANSQVTLHFNDYNSGKLFVSSAYPGIPPEFAKHVNARGDKSVPSQNGDQSIRYSEFEF